MRRLAAAMVVLGLLVAACDFAEPPVTPRPSVAAAAATEAPTEEPGLADRCPAFAFDASASLDPAFEQETFAGDEQRVLGSAFVDALRQLYSGEAGVDPCQWFTGDGLESAAFADDRLGAALAGRAWLDSELRLRQASDGGAYDLRLRPPTAYVDVVFDIPEGSTTTDTATGATDTSLATEREGLRVTFAYDGSRWLADHVERVPPVDAAGWVLPTPKPELFACKGFRDDPDRTPFDDDAGRTIDHDAQRQWCVDGGEGPSLDTDLVSLRTRWPCGDARIAVLRLGLPLGTPSDPLDPHEYIRDPDRQAIERGWLHERWRRVAQPPEDAEDTGWSNGNMDLWIDPGAVEDAVYVRTGGRFERWPRADDPSVIDCN